MALGQLSGVMGAAKQILADSVFRSINQGGKHPYCLFRLETAAGEAALEVRLRLVDRRGMVAGFAAAQPRHRYLASGAITKYSFFNRDGVEIMKGLVGPGGDFVWSNPVAVVGRYVTFIGMDVDLSDAKPWEATPPQPAPEAREVPVDDVPLLGDPAAGGSAFLDGIRRTLAGE